jgi:uracil-DNA glycosylase
MSENSIDPKIEASWKTVLMDQFESPYFLALRDFLKEEYAQHRIYPSGGQIFSAFELAPFHEVKVVILGQDPYHGPGQAHGLSFSVQDGVPFPPSLRNIFKELASDVGVPRPASGDLSSWAAQGVLLLNATLTVRHKSPASHQKKGWETFTNACIQKLSQERENVVFVLWGNYARAKRQLIDANKHLVIESAHPSPFSAHNGFFGSKPFSKVNAYLASHGKTPIDWSLS